MNIHHSFRKRVQEAASPKCINHSLNKENPEIGFQELKKWLKELYLIYSMKFQSIVSPLHTSHESIRITIDKPFIKKQIVPQLERVKTMIDLWLDFPLLLLMVNNH